MLFRRARIEVPPLSRHPSCQTPSKRQTSPDTVPAMFGSDPTGAWCWMEWHPAGFLYYGSLSSCLTLRKIQFIIFSETLKHYHPYHRKVQNLWKITWKRKSWPPKKSISKDSHWNWFVLLSPYPPNECWHCLRFLEASPPGRLPFASPLPSYLGKNNAKLIPRIRGVFAVCCKALSLKPGKLEGNLFEKWAYW